MKLSEKQLSMIGYGLAVAAIASGAFFSGVNVGESGSVESYYQCVTDRTREAVERQDILGEDEMWAIADSCREEQPEEYVCQSDKIMGTFYGVGAQIYINEQKLDSYEITCTE